LLGASFGKTHTSRNYSICRIRPIYWINIVFRGQLHSFDHHFHYDLFTFQLSRMLCSTSLHGCQIEKSLLEVIVWRFHGDPIILYLKMFGHLCCLCLCLNSYSINSEPKYTKPQSWTFCFILERSDYFLHLYIYNLETHKHAYFCKLFFWNNRSIYTKWWNVILFMKKCLLR
jgi:hypothetical protein